MTITTTSFRMGPEAIRTAALTEALTRASAAGKRFSLRGWNPDEERTGRRYARWIAQHWPEESRKLIEFKYWAVLAAAFTNAKEKTCRKCHQPRPASDFPKAPRNRDKLSSWCKQCTAAYQVKYKRDALKKTTRDYNRLEQIARMPAILSEDEDD